MRKLIWLATWLALGIVCSTAIAQGPVTGYCTLGAKQAAVSGLNSTNYLQGIIRGCTVQVYLTGTTTPATLSSNSTGTPLGNPFTANAMTGQWLFYASTASLYDVVMTGGTAPNTYPAPVTLTGLQPGGGGGGGSGCIPSGATNALLKNGGSGTCTSSSVSDNGTTVSTTEPITAPSFNGVALSTAGPNTQYLDKTGNYSTPPDATTPCTSTALSVQFNSSGTFGCLPFMTTNSTFVKLIRNYGNSVSNGSNQWISDDTTCTDTSLPGLVPTNFDANYCVSTVFNSTIAGHNLGNPPIGGGGWTTAYVHSVMANLQGSGIKSLNDNTMHCSGAGDCNGHSLQIYGRSGHTAYSDQGTGYRNLVFEDPEPTGTITTGGSGATSLVVSTAFGDDGVGQFIVDNTYDLISTTQTVTGSGSGAGGGYAIVTLAATVPVSSSCSTVATGATIAVAQAEGIYTSVTITVNTTSDLTSSIGSLFTSIVPFIQTQKIVSVGTFTGTTQTVTMLINKSITAGSPYCVGGLSGRGLEQTAYTFSGNVYLLNIVGSPTAHTAWVSIPIGVGSLPGELYAGAVNIYHMATIVGISGAGRTITDNDARWSSTAPNNTWISTNGLTEQFYTSDNGTNIFNPYATVVGHTFHTEHYQLAPYEAAVLTNDASPANYYSISGLTPKGQVGAWGAPTAMELQGLWGLGMYFQYAPESGFINGNFINGAAISMGGFAPGSTATAWVIADSHVTGDQFTYTPSTHSWNLNTNGSGFGNVDGSHICTVANTLCSGGGSTVIQVNGTPTTTATPVNLRNGTGNGGIAITNPGTGNVDFNLSKAFGGGTNFTTGVSSNTLNELAYFPNTDGRVADSTILITDVMQLSGTQTVTGTKTFSAANAYGTPASIVLTNATGNATGLNAGTATNLLACSDTSASGTAQSCTTSPSFTPGANSCVIYTTTTANTGTGLTLNVNALGAKSVAKWLGTTTLAANDVKATSPQLACHNGTVWNLSTIGNAPSAGGGAALSAITAATGSNTIASGNNGLQIWNWAPTTNQNQFQFGETTAATSGTLGNQYILSAKTLAGSTAVPLGVISSLTGTQTLPTLHITPTWNTSGVVDAALLVNVTNTASGTGSLLADFQIGGTSQWKLDKGGNSTQLGTVMAPTGIITGGFIAGAGTNTTGYNHLLNGSTAEQGQLLISNFNNGASSTGLLFQNSAASNGSGQSIQFQSNDAGFSLRTQALLNVSTTNNTSGALTADMIWQTMSVGTLAESMRLTGPGVLKVVQIAGESSAPTMVAGAAAGVAPTCTSVTGTNISGVISCTTGTAPTTGTLATITFNGTLPQAPQGCTIMARNSATAAASNNIFTTAPSTTVFTIATGAAPLTLSTAYVWSYQCF